MDSPSASLPSASHTELVLSVERAYREIWVVDRLSALWSVILAKCLLAQWAIDNYAIPISGLRYIWSLTLIMAVIASALYLQAHRLKLSFLPNQLRVGSAVFTGLLINLGFIFYAHFALGAISTVATYALAATLLGGWSLVRATLRRAVEPLIAALLWWLVAGLMLRAAPNLSLLWLGLGFLGAQALPTFALVARTQKTFRV